MTRPDLAELAALLGGRVVGDGSVVPTGATCDSRAVERGDLFCCVSGFRTDGHRFAPDAVEAGASALLVERALELAVPQVVVESVRRSMAPAAAAVYERPDRDVTVVGVTGTNGKTTVVSLVAHLLRSAGRNSEVIGTLTGTRTTPEAPELQRLLRSFADEGVEAVAMEVSSHALALHRSDAIEFQVGVFTNLGIDHLDFHGTPEAYFEAKARLFDPGRCRHGLVNLDDTHGRLLRDAGGDEIVGYRLADLDDLEVGPSGSRFVWRGHRVHLPLAGRFNLSNALAAAECALLCGVDAAVVAAGLATVPAVPGRFEVVDAGQPFTVIVDYAHTPDALETVLATAREITAPGGRLTVVFGAGGDRDAGKRPLMGAVAAEGADRIILTNDNPRSEDPFSILAAVATGCGNAPHEIEPDRRAAIRSALAGAAPGDVVVIAGKGHETTQTTGDLVEHFDDREEARAALAEADTTRPGEGGA